MIYATMNQWIVLLAKNWVELVGVIFTLIMFPLVVARKWTAWIISIISSLFYGYINFSKNLYALAAFCFCNVVLSFYGLYCWKFAKSNQNLLFRFITKSLLLKLILTGIAIGLVITFSLKFVDGSNPLDPLITTLNVIAAWMTARKIIESWFLWLISDVLLFALYSYKEMYPSAFLYVIFTVFSIFGYISWRKQAM